MSRFRSTRLRFIEVGVVCLLGLSSCGSTGPHTREHASSGAQTVGTERTVVGIGHSAVSKSSYQQWMTVGAATVEMAEPGKPVARPVVYDPPTFTVCTRQLKEHSPDAAAKTLQARCTETFKSIQRRVLGFLITGYWLREEAKRLHVSVSAGQVHKKFEEEKRSHYPTARSFRRLQQTTRQTVPDLEFAVETQMLSTKLLEGFARKHRHEKSEQATIAAFNKSILSTWISRTTCDAGYVVPDCKEFKP